MMRQNPGKLWLTVMAIVIATTALVGCQEKARGPATASTKPDQPDSPKTSPAPEPATPDEPLTKPQDAKKPATDTQQSQPETTRAPSPRTVKLSQTPPIQRAPTTSAPSTVVALEIRKPKRPITVSWVRFREALEPKQDVTCEAVWTGGNRLEIHTTNIQRMTLDLTKLPEGAPRKGPWIVQIDGQGIEITGFRPKEGYTGKIRDLVCSKNGRWTVDRKALYRGPK